MLEQTIQDITGEGCQFWMDWIGNRIAFHTKDRTTESNLWLRDLADELYQRILPRFDWLVKDENIVCSSMMSLILLLWTCRVRRAKSFDPRRDLEDRKLMLEGLNKFYHCVLDCMVDESKDQRYFPSQEWQSPFVK